jgi:hypothetical protein
MKKIIFIILISLLSLNVSHAQLTIALHHNGQSSFFASFDSLKAHLQTGDTIYFPGGGVNIGDWHIDKTVCVFGVGHNPDSTVATGRTYLTGNIYLKTGADNSFFQGLYLTGSIVFGTNSSDQEVHNITISRCNFVTLNLSFDGSTTTASSYISIRENIIHGGVNGGYANNVTITNNIIQGNIGYFNNLLFTNNIQMNGYCGGGPYAYINNSTFQNNIIITTYYSCSGGYFESGCNSNYFANNIFSWGYGFPDGSSTGNGNWTGTDISTVLVSQSGLSFDYAQDYHLQSPSSYIGTDLIQVGIYGGNFPFKTGSVPQNPHVISKTIQQNTDNSGNLNINVKVKAQDN